LIDFNKTVMLYSHVRWVKQWMLLPDCYLIIASTHRIDYGQPTVFFYLHDTLSSDLMFYRKDEYANHVIRASSFGPLCGDAFGLTTLPANTYPDLVVMQCIVPLDSDV